MALFRSYRNKNEKINNFRKFALNFFLLYHPELTNSLKILKFNQTGNHQLFLKK